MPPTHLAVYLIEDNHRFSEALKEALAQRSDMTLVGHSATLAHALEHAVAARADIYLVDLGLPDGEGFEVIRDLAQRHPESERLVFTVFGDESRLMRALEAGATGYVLKGDGVESLFEAIEHASQGGAPISPILARMLLKHFQAPINAQAQDSANDAETTDDCAPGLTPKETEVLRLITMGYINREIAERMNLSIHTVLTHIKRIYKKLGVRTRVQATNAAKSRQLL